MNKHYKALELDKILNMLKNEATCADAAEMAVELTPSSGLFEVRELLNETSDAHMLIGRFGSPSFGGAKNVSNYLRRAQAGGVLTMQELLRIAETLRIIRSVKQWRQKSEGIETCLDMRFSSLTPNKYLEEKITSSILNEEEMADNASRRLRRYAEKSSLHPPRREIFSIKLSGQQHIRNIYRTAL